MSFEFYLSLDLLTLDSWRGQVDPTDAVIVSFIHKLQANQSIKLSMHRKRDADGDYIHIDHGWLLDRLPILKCRSKDRIQRRLHRLCELGILESFITRDPKTKFKRAYYRTSRDYNVIAEWLKERIGQVRNSGELEALLIKRPRVKPANKGGVGYDFNRDDRGRFRTYR